MQKHLDVFVRCLPEYKVLDESRKVLFITFAVARAERRGDIHK
jgi:hypothetical protein